MYFGRRVRHNLDVKNRLFGSGGFAPQCGNDRDVVFDVDKDEATRETAVEQFANRVCARPRHPLARQIAERIAQSVSPFLVGLLGLRAVGAFLSRRNEPGNVPRKKLVLVVYTSIALRNGFRERVH